MDNSTIKKTLSDSKPEPVGVIEFLVEATRSRTSFPATSLLPAASPQRTTSVQKDTILLAKADTSTNDFTSTTQSRPDGGLSLFDLFLMTRTEEERAELDKATNAIAFKTLKDFVASNQSIGEMILSTNGQTVNSFVKNYNPDAHGAARQYFDSATLYKPSPSIHIQEEKLSLWDENLSNFRHKSEFGRRKSPVHGGSTFHKGIDLATPLGTDLRSEGQTQVAFAGKAKGFGNVVILSHGDGIYTLYGHLSRIGNLRKGQILEDGQKFADTGRSGIVTGPCLHLEVLVASKGRLYAIDPNLVSEGKVDLHTSEGRAAAVLINARSEGVSVARTASLMEGKIKLPAPEFSPS